ncbi:hypothetical protein [Fictibacillus terranigra]|uniref:Uncharacterized protein n=1 Tax=Fictibacillus terranigra TaxID=3058424 RepID=A0ABT8EB51_9BACL|nr:hypothetical protein [Fictibacillus sp. CENA-BCM004]MDN4075150.1 hypothetical protein [Fictibacillus sp. CENA-BCM004]
MKVHIVNGDITGNKLKPLDGEVIVWREMYDLGPVSADMDEKKVKNRAEFFERKLGVPAEIFLQNSVGRKAGWVNSQRRRRLLSGLSMTDTTKPC